MANVKNIKVNGKNCWGVLSSGDVVTLPEKVYTSPTIGKATTDYTGNNEQHGTEEGSKFTATLWQGEFYLPSAVQAQYGVPILTIYSSDQSKVLFKLTMYTGSFQNDTFYDALLSNGTYGTARKYAMTLYSYRYSTSGTRVEFNTYDKWYPNYVSSNPIHFWSGATRVHIKITLDEENKQLLLSILNLVTTGSSSSNSTGQNAVIGKWDEQRFGTGSSTSQYAAATVVAFNDDAAPNTGVDLGGLFPIKVKTFRPLINWKSDKYTTATKLVNTYNFPQLKK